MVKWGFCLSLAQSKEQTQAVWGHSMPDSHGEEGSSALPWDCHGAAAPIAACIARESRC